MYIGAFCIGNAPTLLVATTVIVLFAIGLCPVATSLHPVATGSV